MDDFLMEIFFEVFFKPYMIIFFVPAVAIALLMIIIILDWIFDDPRRDQS